MKICTWNVNSLNARADFVAMYLDKEAPDVIGIQELKLETTEVPTEIFTSRGYHVALHAQRQWNGVLLAAKQPITDIERGLEADEDEARMVSGVIGGVRYVNLYCPQGQSVESPKFAYKLRFYDSLIAWLGQRITPDQPTVVLGDMNVAPDPEDIWDPIKFAGVPSFHPLEHERWKQLVDLGLRDPVKQHLDKVIYSYWDYRAGCFHKNQGMRIDHILVTEHLFERVQTAWIDRDERKKKGGLTPSDHAPVVLQLA